MSGDGLSQLDARKVNSADTRIVNDGQDSGGQCQVVHQSGHLAIPGYSFQQIEVDSFLCEKVTVGDGQARQPSTEGFDGGSVAFGQSEFSAVRKRPCQRKPVYSFPEENLLRTVELRLLQLTVGHRVFQFNDDRDREVLVVHSSQDTCHLAPRPLVPPRARHVALKRLRGVISGERRKENVPLRVRAKDRHLSPDRSGTVHSWLRYGLDRRRYLRLLGS